MKFSFPVLALFVALVTLSACQSRDSSVVKAASSEGEEKAMTQHENPIALPLKKLLDQMAVIGATSEEVDDTDVREQMHDAILHAFVMNESAYVLPNEFGMFSPGGNTAVRGALAAFLKDAVPAAARGGLKTPQARLDAFQDSKVVGSRGESFDDYFGEREGL